uniref:Uncharacterized protein n=1 Tax=Sphaerodactylus townsendi TaxID=933632 RepID=A0ACB8G5G1_9SAUR
MGQLSDSSGRYWEDLATSPDSSVTSLNGRKHPEADSSIPCMTALEASFPPEEEKPLQKAAIWASRGSHADLDMEMDNDLQRVNESLGAGIMVDLPHRSSKPSDHPKGTGVFGEPDDLMLDPSSLMDIDILDSSGLLQNLLGTSSLQPLLAAPIGDIVMHNEMGIRNTKEIPVLEWVGETLRKQKLQAMQI